MAVTVSLAHPLPSGSCPTSHPKIPATSGAVRSWSSKSTSGAPARTVRPRAARRGRRASRRLHVGEVLGEVLAQDVADPAALGLGGEAVAPEQLLLLDDRVGPRQLPARREQLEQQLGAALPGVLPRQRRAVHGGGVLLPGGGAERAAQGEHVALRRAVLGLGSLDG